MANNTKNRAKQQWFLVNSAAIVDCSTRGLLLLNALGMMCSSFLFFGRQQVRNVSSCLLIVSSSLARRGISKYTHTTGAKQSGYDAKIPQGTLTLLQQTWLFENIQLCSQPSTRRATRLSDDDCLATLVLGHLKALDAIQVSVGSRRQAKYK